jgi:hypothetical protein
MRTEYTLPTDLAPILINGDFTGLDYIDDEDYEEAVMKLLSDLNSEGLECIGVGVDSSFCKYHDMREYGVLACDCSIFIFN